MYRKAKPFFLGLIMGQVLATVFWCAVAVVLVLLGKAYMAVSIQMA